MAKTCKEMYLALDLARQGMTAYAIEKKFKSEGLKLTRMAICKRPEYKEILFERRKHENSKMRETVEQIIDDLAEELNSDVNTVTPEENKMLGYMDELEKFAEDNGI